MVWVSDYTHPAEKSFILRYPKPGKPTQSSLMTLGEWTQGHKSLSLYQAREIAGRIRTQVFAGEDPKRRLNRGNLSKSWRKNLSMITQRRERNLGRMTNTGLDKYILPLLEKHRLQRSQMTTWTS